MSPLSLVLLALNFCCYNSVEFRLANTLGNNMVLQQEPYKSQIWGFSDINSKIELELINETNNKIIQNLSTITSNNNDNIWLIQLNPMKTSNTSYKINVSSSTSNITLSINNILFGDVYLCSGQSNMQFTVPQVINSTEYLQEANNYSYIRLFTSQNNMLSNTPQNELTHILQKWSIANNKTVGCGNWSCFSAVCWFTGLNIYKRYKYPIGLISSTHSGAPIICFLPYNTSSKCGEYNFPEQSSYKPSNCFNAEINPFLRTTIKSVLWYQGEEDTKYVPYDYKYSSCFPIMINEWRYYFNLYSNTDILLPFGFVQLSVFLDSTENKTCNNNMSVSCTGAAVVRLGQLANYSYTPNNLMLNTYFATAIDLGDPYTPYIAPLGPVHPRYKVQIGERLANASFNVVYGDSSEYFGGPHPTKAVLNQTKTSSSNGIVNIMFENVASEGILIKNMIGFELYDIDIGWFDVFNIKNNGLSSVNIEISINIKYTNITMVRYNFYTAPCLPFQGIYNCALYDKQHLIPVVPFLMNVTNL